MANYLKFGFQTSRLAKLPPDVMLQDRPTNTRFKDIKTFKDKGRFLLTGAFFFTCQNSIPAAIAGLMEKVYKANPRMTIRADDASIPFDLTKAKYDYEKGYSTDISMLSPERMDRVMGGYASLVSPMVSPYFVRHLIDDYRMEVGHDAMGGPSRNALTKRLEVIREAANEGVPLNTNLRETWGVDYEKGYGMFRTEPLWQTTPSKFRDNTGYFAGKGHQPPTWDDMCRVFPPRSIRKVMVT